MTDDLELVLVRLLLALAAGSLIGLERTYHGRPAGFRTHCLVCTASSVLMLLVTFQFHSLPEGVSSLQIDPTRMAQGIMTGIGFLGGGVIVREGITVRGLTTAASIWVTAAIGITAGVGFYGTTIMATILAVGILSVFRWLERVIPTQTHAQLVVTCDASHDDAEEKLLDLLEKHAVVRRSMAYGMDSEESHGRRHRFAMAITTRKPAILAGLAKSLNASESVCSYDIQLTGD